MANEGYVTVYVFGSWCAKLSIWTEMSAAQTIFLVEYFQYLRMDSIESLSKTRKRNRNVVIVTTRYIKLTNAIP